MFEYDLDSPEMVFFTWQPPPSDQQNGVITRYDIVCTPSSGNGEPVNGRSDGAFNATVGMFIPATQYSCTITASTSVGTGPGITVTVVTCELIEWTFVFHCCCISWLLKLLQPEDIDFRSLTCSLQIVDKLGWTWVGATPLRSAGHFQYLLQTQ